MNEEKSDGKFQIKMRIGCEDLLPKFAHEGDAARDLHSRTNQRIFPGEIKLIQTGVFMAIPIGFEFQIRPRSGLALKHGITITNAQGTIDSGYRGEIGVILQNCSDYKIFEIKYGDRIAQGVICKIPNLTLEVVKELPDSKRGDRGFGSTGVA